MRCSENLRRIVCISVANRGAQLPAARLRLGLECAPRAVGSIAETIIDQAKRSDSDMICMGTRGMTALASMALGSVATRVLHLAEIPVMLIH